MWLPPLWRAATAMHMLGEPWPQVQEAYLRAWEYRPSRAEPLHDIAVHYRENGRYVLGHLFAQRAAQIPCPPEDALFINPEVYHFRALDEQAVCAARIGSPAEAQELCDRLLTLPGLPEEDRVRIAANRAVVAGPVAG